MYACMHACKYICMYVFFWYTHIYLSKIWLLTLKVIQISTAVDQYLPTIGPALLLSMEYMDLGKWVVAIEGGAHIGLHLILVLFFFNCSGILCRYLANLIGIVTRKNLAQVISCVLAKFDCLVSFVLANMECSLH